MGRNANVTGIAGAGPICIAAIASRIDAVEMGLAFGCSVVSGAAALKVRSIATRTVGRSVLGQSRSRRECRTQHHGESHSKQLHVVLHRHHQFR
jgi:hypothetical protein